MAEPACAQFGRRPRERVDRGTAGPQESVGDSKKKKWFQGAETAELIVKHFPVKKVQEEDGG